jgi:hypothetical protein
MRRKIIATALCVVMAVSIFAAMMPTATAEPISITNAGFETGNTMGWWTAGAYSSYRRVLTYHYTGYSAYARVYAKEGRYFLRLQGNSPYYYSGWYSGYWQATMARQYISVSAGETISGWAGFEANDYMPFNDYAWVRIKTTGLSTIAQPWYRSLSSVPYYGYSGWNAWSYTFSSGGTYVLEYCARNRYDSVGDPYAFFDMSEGPPVVTTLRVTDGGFVRNPIAAGGMGIGYATVENVGEEKAMIESLSFGEGVNIARTYDVGGLGYPKELDPGEDFTIFLGACVMAGTPEPATGMDLRITYNSESGQPLQETVDVPIKWKELGGDRSEYVQSQDAFRHMLCLNFAIGDGIVEDTGEFDAAVEAFLGEDYKRAKKLAVSPPGVPGLGFYGLAPGQTEGNEGNGNGGLNG